MDPVDSIQEALTEAIKACGGTKHVAAMLWPAKAAADLSYAEPTPIEPKDELADLLRQYLARREEDGRKDERLDRLLQQHLGLRSAA